MQQIGEPTNLEVLPGLLDLPVQIDCSAFRAPEIEPVLP
jgi:hypothetical protein